MGPRTKTLFLLLVGVQCAHSIEEYLTHLYKVLAPARYVSGLFSENLAVGFVAFNSIVVLLGFGCYFGPIRAARGAAVIVAWAWVVIELANGVGHILLALNAGGYFPGLVTGVALLLASAYLARSLRADREIREKVPARSPNNSLQRDRDG